MFAQTGPTAIAPASGVSEAGEDKITVNFVDADVREVVKSIIGTALKAPFMIDPKVQGQITVQTSLPVSRGDAVLLLENALKINGAALVEAGGSYSVVPLQDAPRGIGAPRLLVSEHDRSQGFGVQIIPLHNISAPEMAKVLQPFVPQDRILKADPSRSVLIVAGTRQELKTVQELVTTFDVDWLKGMSFGMFPLETVKPSEMVKDLTAMFGGGEDGPLGGMIRFVPIDRLNAILVIAQRPNYLKQVQTWIQDLDRADASDAPRLYVYYVQNGNAENLATTLSEIFGSGRGGGGGGGTSLDVAPGNLPATLRGGLGGGGSGSRGGWNAQPLNHQNLRSGLTPSRFEPAPKRKADGIIPVVDMPTVSPESLTGGARNALSTTEAALPGGVTPNVRVIADRDKNALVIMASPRDFQMVQDAIRRLDIAPLQVLIEATIAEVTLNDDLRYGVEWFFKRGNHTLALTDPTTGLIAPLPGFSYLFSSGVNDRVVLNALSSITDVNVISSPHLLVLDNQTARLQVGDQVPVATQSAVSVLNPDSPIVNSISFRDTGVILEVRPRVGAGGNVLLDISQEVSDVVPTRTSGIDSPTIQQRNVHSTVSVMDGQAVALGGLIKDNKTNGRSGIPILSDIPVLGFLFGSTTKGNARTELLIMLTPHVIRTHLDAQQATDELQQRMRTIDPLNTRIR